MIELGSFIKFLKVLYYINAMDFLNPLLHMPILGSSNSVANKDMMSKTFTNEDTIF